MTSKRILPPPVKFPAPSGVQAKAAPRTVPPPPVRFAGPSGPAGPRRAAQPMMSGSPPPPPPPPGMHCQFCFNPGCMNGSICGKDMSFSGLFPPSTTSRFVGKHKHTKKHSKRKRFESEHVLPSKALKNANKKFKYDDEITISIPYDMHRKGQSGAGGGVSSTGSSGTAKGWSQRLGAMISGGDRRGAIRATLMDELHSAHATGNLDFGMMSAFLQYLLLSVQEGHINNQDVDQIFAALYGEFDRYSRMK